MIWISKKWINLFMIWDRFKAFILLFLVFIGGLNAQVTYTGNNTGYLGRQVEVFSTHQEIEFSSILKQESVWTKTDDDILNFGISDESHWVKFNAVNESEHPSFWLQIENPSIDLIDLWVISETGEVIMERHAGESRPFESRGNSFKDFVFELPIEAGVQSRVLIHVKAGEQLMLPMRFTDYAGVINTALNENVIIGTYLGIILVMFFYNLFIFYSTRDRSYALYVIYIILIGFTQFVLQGFGFQWFWPEINALAIRATNFVGVLSGIAVLAFAREFLKIRNRWPKVDNVVILFIALDIVAFVLTAFGELNLAFNIINMVAAIGSLYLLVVAIVLAIRGVRSARFFSVAWSVFLLSVVFYVLKDFDVVPYNQFTNGALMAGSSVEIILLSFALADRINVLKDESEIAQKRELEAVKEKEKLVSEQNIVLEQKVAERTSELRSANDQLNKTLHELKQAQVQLVNAEKMASLGQLTAGIAHEINNPINFVAASVAPLKQDVQDLRSVLSEYESAIAQSDESSLKNRLDAFKKQMDFDFTMNEIDELLNGVEEGARRTAEIVQGLKNFSRLDESESKLADVNECLDSTLIVIQNILKDKINVIKKYDSNIQPIECYPGKLNQLFSNIIVNAAQALRGTPDATIVIRTMDAGTNIEISIEDNGPGIPDEIKNRIFEPFFTTKDVGEGTGLGLSIAYSIVELHKGVIDLISEAGKGTTFKITIPKLFND
ncbi:MAG: 7TM diverse intracellular signaling domain-containing protein [Flavobacteriales bacterium]